MLCQFAKNFQPQPVASCPTLCDKCVGSLTSSADHGVWAKCKKQFMQGSSPVKNNSIIDFPNVLPKKDLFKRVSRKKFPQENFNKKKSMQVENSPSP